jgi:transposase
MGKGSNHGVSDWRDFLIIRPKKFQELSERKGTTLNDAVVTVVAIVQNDININITLADTKKSLSIEIILKDSLTRESSACRQISISNRSTGFSLDQLVPEDHLLRKIDNAIDFTFIYDLFQDKYSETGRPCVDPVVLINIVLIQYLSGIRSMRQTIRENETNVAYRWFIGYDFTQPIPHFSTFGKNYIRRFRDTDLFESILQRILEERFAMDLWTRTYCSSIPPMSRQVPTGTKPFRPW